jgi:hypothetical protein
MTPPAPKGTLAGALARPWRRLYPFEWLLLAQVAAMLLFLHLRGFGKVFGTLVFSFKAFLIMPVVLSLAGMALTAAFLTVRPRTRPEGLRYLRGLLTWEWWVLSARLWVGIVLTTHVYTWLKLCTPDLNPGTVDQALWALENRLFLGVSPNIVFLELFHHPWILSFVDWSYAKFFMAGLWGAIIFFPALPSTRLRVSAITGFALLWTTGGWLHVLIPALGPCYWFPGLWKPYAAWLHQTLHSQASLLENYQRLALFRHGADFTVNPLWGVAAFPSMHNANQFLLAFWAWRLGRFTGWVVALSAVAVFFGSVLTGWHYLVDSVAGVLMAWGAFALSVRLLRSPKAR